VQTFLHSDGFDPYSCDTAVEAQYLLESLWEEVHLLAAQRENIAKNAEIAHSTIQLTNIDKTLKESLELLYYTTWSLFHPESCQCLNLHSAILHTPAQGAPLAVIVAASDNIELVLLVLKVVYLLLMEVPLLH
jgi:hypothetical protein